MPKPIQHLIETIGAKPTLLGSGAISLGGATLSTASFAVGFFTLLAATGVLPNGLASLGVAGGIVFTAAGPIGLLTSAGFFVFMAMRVRLALQTHSSQTIHPIEEESISRVSEEEKDKTSTLKAVYDRFDEELEAAKTLRHEETKKTPYFNFTQTLTGSLHITINYVMVGDDFQLGNRDSHVILKDTTLPEFMERLFDHIDDHTIYGYRIIARNKYRSTISIVEFKERMH